MAASDPYRAFRGPLRFAAAAVILLLLSLSAIFLWRGLHYGSLYEDLRDQEIAVFREALPGQAVPASIKLRLESEAQRFRGVSGAAHDLPQQASALHVLYETLRRLPTELRYRILELRIDGDRIYIDGQARSHGDADLIAAALRRQNGLEVQPPKTEQIGGAARGGRGGRGGANDRGGVTFTLTGTAPAGLEPAAQPPTQLAQQHGGEQ